MATDHKTLQRERKRKRMIGIENGKKYKGIKNEIHQEIERKGSLKAIKKKDRKTDRKKGKKGK